ncbi:MAG: PaaI family thioesterase [Piscinibacter sp.]|uniref:PaaI family thioesterase n=1 Tax=Piscinibacter sp. TaxID=1903157 RepID=UPI003D10F5FD
MSATAVPEGFGELRLGGDFVKANGPLYESFEGDAYRLGFRVEKRHCNTMRICHGGMMATFCDMLLPITAIRSVETLGERFLPTVSLDIDYLAPAPLGSWVQGQAQVLRSTRSLVFAQGLVTADGEPVARVSGVFKIGAAFAPPRAGGDGG